MVSRFVLYWIFFLSFMLMLFLGWGWLWHTNQGARWALSQANHFASLRIESVDGRLSGPLVLSGLTFRSGKLVVRAEQVSLRWRPSALLYGSVHVEDLSLNGIHIQDDRPPAPATAPTFRLPQLPSWLAQRHILLKRLYIQGLQYNRGATPIYHLYNATTAVNLAGGTIKLPKLVMQDQYGGLSGMLKARLDNSRLQGQGVWLPVKTSAVQALYWVADWRAGADGNPTGPLYLLMRGQGAPLGYMHTQLVLEPHALRFYRTRFDWKGMPDVVNFAGRLAFPQGQPFADVHASADWNLGRVAPSLRDTGLIWQAGIRGWLAQYTGKIQLRGKGAAWRQGAVSGDIAGNLQGLHARQVEGAVLGGKMQGVIDVSWARDMMLNLEGRFSHLNPGLVSSAWPGNLNGGLRLQGQGKGFFDQGRFRLDLDKSLLHRQSFQGRIAAGWHGKDLAVSNAHLYGHGVDIRGQGNLAKSLDLRVLVANLANVTPQAAGSVTAQAALAYRRGVLAVQTSARGTGLRYGAYSVSAVSLAASLPQGMKGLLNASVDLRDLSNGKYRMQNLIGRVKGTLKQQSWQINAGWPSGNLALAAQGTQQGASLAGPWRWRLSTLTAYDRQAGRWQLVSPAMFYVDADTLRISPLMLRDQNQGRVQLGADLKMRPWGGRFNAAWRNLPILPGYFPASLKMSVQGRVSGDVQGQLLADQQLNVRGTAQLGTGVIHWQRPGGELVADVKTARAQFSWSGAQLQGNAQLDLAGYGHATGSFALPLPARYPVAFAADGPLHGQASFKVEEKGMLLVALPGIVQEGAGQLQGTVTAGGTWAQPRLGGDVVLRGAAAFVPKAGIYVTDIGAHLILKGDTVQLAALQAHSGQGNLSGNGSITLQGFKPAGYHFSLTGSRFRALDLPLLQADVSPQLEIRSVGEVVQVRGEIVVPYARITGASPAGVKPSGDVILVDEAKPKGPPLTEKVDLLVQLVLGQDVEVKAQGASANLTGTLAMRLQGAQEPQAHGRIKVVNGVYEGYGQKLKVEHGFITFAGPIDQPNLNVYAARKVDQVTAGILITGVWPKPKTVLTSTPAMPPADILSYIVLGHPMAAGGGQSSLLAQAAGGLLNLGEAAKLRKSLQGGLGLDTLDITPTGTGLNNFMVTVGKRLNPRLYVSIGRSVFTNDIVARARYQLSKFWELQAESGTQSGVDAFYRIEMR